MRKSLYRGLIAALLLGCMPFVAAPAATAASNCSPIDLGKQAVGSIQVGKMVVDLEKVNYPAGGDLYPPDTARIAGISTRHNKLSASVGSSLIVWHDYWKGCNGNLDVLTKQKPGFKFTVSDEKGKKRVFEIVEVTTVKMGDYRDSWFSLNGPRQLVMVTCAGKLVDGHKVLNTVVRAVPVV